MPAAAMSPAPATTVMVQEMLRAAWARRWGIAIAAQMAAAGATGYLTTPQGSAQMWLYRVVVGEAITGTAWFTVYYGRRGGWRSHIGQTILTVKLLLLGALTPALLSLFPILHLPPRVSAAIDAGTLASIGLAMAWRRGVWAREVAAPDELERRLAALAAENERLAAENERLRAR